MIAYDKYKRAELVRKRKELALDVVCIWLPITSVVVGLAYYAAPTIHNVVAWFVAFAP